MHLKSQKGFTLPEVILIIAALAIVSTMALPDIALFFKRQSVEQEKVVLRDIQKALDSYARECNALPSLTGNPLRANCQLEGTTGPLTWYEALAAFSNLSAENIQKDVWENNRRYTHGINSRTYRQGPVNFHYATVRSVGEDRCDNTTTGLPCPISPEATFTPDWDISANLTSYEQFEVDGDDLMVKYTDNQRKIAAQDETVRRLERIIDALDRYAQARFNEEVHAGVTCISEKLFYPPSLQSEVVSHNNPNHPDPDCRNLGTNINDRYGQAVLDDVLIISSADNWVDTQNVGLLPRRNAMITLMRILGLPEDHCCSAVTGVPFYYYSNPPTGAGVYATMPPYFPPQVRVDPLF